MAKLDITAEAWIAKSVANRIERDVRGPVVSTEDGERRIKYDTMRITATTPTRWSVEFLFEGDIVMTTNVPGIGMGDTLVLSGFEGSFLFEVT